MSMLLKRTKANIFRISNQIVIYPGNNHLTDEQEKILVNHPCHQGMLDTGTHIIIEKKAAGAKVDSDKKTDTTSEIAEMNSKDAITVIQETYAIPLLENMHNAESEGKSRKTVLAAIVDQIEDIKAPPEDDNDENKDED